MYLSNKKRNGFPFAMRLIYTQKRGLSRQNTTKTVDFLRKSFFRPQNGGFSAETEAGMIRGRGNIAMIKPYPIPSPVNLS
jgi:hypothetical protein